MGKRSRDLAAPGSPALLAAGLVVLALCVVVTASGSGVRWPGADLERPDRQEQSAEGPERGAADDEPEPAGRDDRAEVAEPPPWLFPGRLVALALLVASLLLVGSVLAQLRVSLRRRRPTPPPRAPVDLPAPTDSGADDVEDFATALEEGLADLASGRPRNSIVAAWLRLESAAESERFRRHPADTPSEFVARVLASYDLDADAIGELAGLYREARFSEHPISERQRDRALACLTTLLDGLRAPHRRGLR